MISANAALPGSYNYDEVARSVVIAIAASYAGLDLAGRVTAARGRVRLPSWEEAVTKTYFTKIIDYSPEICGYTFDIWPEFARSAFEGEQPPGVFLP
jgi:hypothetical protein